MSADFINLFLLHIARQKQRLKKGGARTCDIVYLRSGSRQNRSEKRKMPATLLSINNIALVNQSAFNNVPIHSTFAMQVYAKPEPVIEVYVRVHHQLLVTFQ